MQVVFVCPQQVDGAIQRGTITRAIANTNIGGDSDTAYCGLVTTAQGMFVNRQLIPYCGLVMTRLGVFVNKQQRQTELINP